MRPPPPPPTGRQIETYRAFKGSESLEDDEDIGLAKAEDILRRVRRREIYRFINEIKIPTNTPPQRVESIIKVCVLER